MADTKIDYVEALQLAGETDPAKATGLLKVVDQFNKLAGVLALLGIDVKGLLKGLIAKYLKDKKAVEPSAPAPQASPTPAPTTAPQTAPAPISPPTKQITSFHLKPFWYQESAGSPTVSKAEFDAVVSRANPMVPRSRLAFDCTIFDQFGKEWFIAHGSQEAVDELWFGADDAEPNTQRMRWFWDGGDDVAEVHDNADGFNPIIKIGKDALPEKGKDYETGQLFGRFTRRDGTQIETPRFPSLRAKR